jgi:hypothetical protein
MDNAIELTADQSEVADQILSTEATEAQQEAARRFINSFGYTTTALFALSQALDEMNEGETPTASVLLLRRAVQELARVEATEI